MVLCEDGECGVCLQPYSRTERIPRMLHCRHTFCEACLEAMAQVRSRLQTVGCPLCRRVTCVSRGLRLQEALWVDSRLWDRIPEDVDREEGLKQPAEDERMGAKQETEVERVPSRSSRAKLKLPGFLRRFSLMKQNQERIVPGSNVEMKSWRRLATEEAV